MEKPPREPKGPWLGCLIICAVSGGLGYFYWGTVAGSLFIVVSVVSLIAAVFLSMENFKWRKGRFEVELMLREALDDNRVEVYNVEATRVIVEIDEHGPQVYYFELCENRVLRLKIGSIHWPSVDPGNGCALYVGLENGAWPNDHFEIVRTVTGGLWVGVFCLGEKLEPLRQINVIEDLPLIRTCDSPVALYEGSFEHLSGQPLEEWN